MQHDRSGYLWRISCGLGHTAGEGAIRTVAELRRRYPGIAAEYGKLTLENLDKLLRRIEAGERFEHVPPPKKRGPKRRSRLSDLEIRAARHYGESFVSIARRAGITPERVRQICKKKSPTG